MIKPVLYIAFFIILFSLNGYAQQNLVPNPSFEEYSSCPTGPDFSGTNELEKAVGWWKPNEATTDYYNICVPISSGASVPYNWLGYQEAYHGNAYVGLGIVIPESPEHSEYIQCKLKQPLVACQMYHFKMYVSLSNFSSHSTNTLGIRFDKTAIYKTQPLVYDGFEMLSHISHSNPITDTLNWQLFEGEYLSKGGEQYLTIGRFFSDTLLFNNNNVPNIDVGCDSCFPLHNWAYFYIDNISLIEMDKTNQSSSKLPNIITANDDEINDYWYPNGVCFSNWKCSIINRWGNTVFTFTEGEDGWNGYDLNGERLNEGTYFYTIDNDEQKLTGFIQLVR